MADKTTSIYSVKQYYPSEEYNKNDIVYVRETIGNSGIPKKFKYFPKKFKYFTKNFKHFQKNLKIFPKQKFRKKT